MTLPFALDFLAWKCLSRVLDGMPLATKLNFLHMCTYSRMDLIPFYARLAATLNPCLDDVATTLVDILIRDLRFQIKKKDQIHIHSKLKNVRFLGKKTPIHVIIQYTCMTLYIIYAILQ